MGSAAKDLLGRFDRLPENEQVAVAREIRRRTAPIDSGPLEEAELTAASDALFAMLDKEESDASRRSRGDGEKKGLILDDFRHSRHRLGR